MDDARALHTAARRYCQDRFAEWAGAYEDLQRKENWRVQKLFQPGWDFSDEACRTFPRYRVAKNTQIEIERLVASSDMSLAEMRKCLIAASDKAKTTLQTELTNKLARNAIREEAADFRVYVETLTPEDLVQVEALPYRRVLSKQESERLWRELRKVWGIGDGYWFPLKEGPAPSNILAFHTDYFESINGEALVHEALEQRGVSKLFLLHEFGDPEYEIDLSIFVPGYRDGGEQYSTSTDTDWMVYASHESSITVCGEWMNQLLRKLHPECAERTYKGPYSTPDLRGTWETTR
jgi:hypothetical protein